MTEKNDRNNERGKPVEREKKHAPVRLIESELLDGRLRGEQGVDDDIQQQSEGDKIPNQEQPAIGFAAAD